ncbi:uncharacterized protein Gasu_61320 [Galdieria sulphuraria]|uniref:Uncharacterized protein n=1 Tax=Galdieria sulphuraria TaxID=130081 RepID=M2XS24_GALSU|nr:uncharacterized protein Gasu_61320 [Galdieria sulphuraria]EME26224.1 hypothetical protein Gasu_61320 [Galdieria sulphuraria]|eukprot:XP_005702744.1 hypothetical protein Gasu_61320 [Galdieria sulphuraria]
MNGKSVRVELVVAQCYKHNKYLIEFGEEYDEDCHTDLSLNTSHYGCNSYTSCLSFVRLLTSCEYVLYKDIN